MPTLDSVWSYETRLFVTTNDKRRPPAVNIPTVRGRYTNDGPQHDLSTLVNIFLRLIRNSMRSPIAIGAVVFFSARNSNFHKNHKPTEYWSVGHWLTKLGCPVKISDKLIRGCILFEAQLNMNLQQVEKRLRFTVLDQWIKRESWMRGPFKFSKLRSAYLGCFISVFS